MTNYIRNIRNSIVLHLSGVLSFPIRCYLTLYPLSTNDLLSKRKKTRLYFARQAYNSFLGMCVDIPFSVHIGSNVNFVHNSFGTVIHPLTRIGNNVKIYQGVTIGRGNIWEDNISLEGFEIKDNAVLCAGAKIICSKGKLVVGEGTVIGANAILTCSTGDYEIWAGVPAIKIGVRNKKTELSHHSSL